MQGFPLPFSQSYQVTSKVSSAIAARLVSVIPFCGICGGGILSTLGRKQEGEGIVPRTLPWTAPCGRQEGIVPRTLRLVRPLSHCGSSGDRVGRHCAQNLAPCAALVPLWELRRQEGIVPPEPCALCGPRPIVGAQVENRKEGIVPRTLVCAFPCAAVLVLVCATMPFLSHCGSSG